MRRRLMYSKPSGGLPEGYTKLNYLFKNHSNNSYIDTGIKPNQNTEVELQYMKIDGGWAKDSYGMVYGSRVSTNQNAHYFYSNSPGNTTFAGFADIAVNPTSGVDYNVLYTVKNGKDGLYIQGVLNQSYTGYSSFQSSLNLYLFGLNGNGSLDTRTFNGNIYYFKVRQSGVLICDLIPAQRNSDGKYGFYDLISRNFFTNAGTGDFIGG